MKKLFEKEHRNAKNSIEPDISEMIKQNTRLIKERDELRLAYSELKTLFEGIDKVLYSVDMVSYELLQMSAACEKVYGHTSAEFFADSHLWQKVIHPDDRHIAMQHMEELGQGKRILNQYRIIHKDKSIRWLENTIIPTLDETGSLIRI